MSDEIAKSAQKENVAEMASEVHGLWRACLAALIAGALIGLVGAYFRAGLVWLGGRHTAFVEWAQQWPWLGWLLPVALGAVAAAVARVFVRMEPFASGSGVQHVEAIMRDQAKAVPIWVVPTKFLGGLIGIGSGLALGREGPTVQMGSGFGAFFAKLLRCGKSAVQDVQAALGGAGLAVAFNAPIGGAMFVFEEVARAFRLRLTLITIIATAMAIVVSRIVLGNKPDFDVEVASAGPNWMLLAYVLFGLLAGLLGVLYNKLTLWGLNVMDNMRALCPEARAAIVGAIVGLVAWFAPTLVGGGDFDSQRILSGVLPLGAVAVILFVRWFLGPLSYSVGTPGGLFAPLLLVGAAMGAVFAMLFNLCVPEAYAIPSVAFAIVGMTAFFTGVVRAPFTGMLLIADMTATSTLMTPMLVACAAAMLSSSLVRGQPIYDSLRVRMLSGFKHQGRP